MSRFNDCIDHILEIEGGFVNDPDDRGGATKYGITLGFYRKYVDSTATVETIQSLTRQEAKEIYRKFFWTPAEFRVGDWNYGNLPIGVDRFTLSMSINAGWRRSHKLLQQGIQIAGGEIGEAGVDGWLGKNTVQGANSVENDLLIQSIGVELGSFYTSIVLNDRSQRKFMKGWLKRAFSETVRSVQDLN